MKKGVALIPARSGSKGFPDKNIAKLCGKSLIEHAVDVGLEAKFLDAVYISTDSIEYERIAIDAGAKSLGLRSSDLSSDTALSINVAKDFLLHPELPEYDYLVLLQPTTPERSSEQIDGCIQQHMESNESVVTVSQVNEPHPDKLKKINEDGVLVSYIDGADSGVPRQKLPVVYKLTGAIYVSSAKHIVENESFFSECTVPYITKDVVNIDSELDYDYLRFLMGELREDAT